MENSDMSNLINQINNMMKNNEIPDDIKSIINNITNNSQEQNATNSEKASSSSPEFDMATIMKMKSIIDAMKTNNNDPRANLLKSLKPYLKESRKAKVDQYIQIFNIGKVFETLNPLGGENHK